MSGLHHVKEHVKHGSRRELSAHLHGNAKTASAVFLSKEMKSQAMLRGSDYRRILTVTMLPSVIVCKTVTCQIISLLVLISTLAELAKLLYATDSDLTPRVLRLYNVVIIHTVACIKILDPPQILSREQMFRLYFHKLTSHSPEEICIVSRLCQVDRARRAPVHWRKSRL